MMCASAAAGRRADVARAVLSPPQHDDARASLRRFVAAQAGGDAHGESYSTALAEMRAALETYVVYC